MKVCWELFHVRYQQNLCARRMVSSLGFSWSFTPFHWLIVAGQRTKCFSMMFWISSNVSLSEWGDDMSVKTIPVGCARPNNLSCHWVSWTNVFTCKNISVTINEWTYLFLLLKSTSLPNARISAYVEVKLLNDSLIDEYEALLDKDTDTCIDSEFKLKHHYLVDLLIPQILRNGIVKVYFNQTVDCEGRQVCNFRMDYLDRFWGSEAGGCGKGNNKLITARVRSTTGR